ncbi:MAG: universal stress protein [Desulfobacteraceae bacterium]|nr:MAG: universal stress protein [Desulfobacteraceae bacterium]
MKILVGYKGTNVGKDLLDIAVKHAKAFDGDVQIVTSMIGGDQAKGETIATAESNLESAKAYCEDQGIKVETHLLIRGMEPGEDILQFAKEIKAEEIIIGVKSRSKVGKLLFGSAAQFVILNAEIPVVSVK